jgi:rRNA biogenesis protein RRP5
MNLENVYGTDESLESVFKDAARHCEPKTVHLRLASILDESGKHEVKNHFLLFFFSFLFSTFFFVTFVPAIWIWTHLSLLCMVRVQKAEEQYKRSCKKFGQSSKVWTLFAEHYLKRGEVEQARKLLPRSLQSLEKRKRKMGKTVFFFFFLFACLHMLTRESTCTDLKTISKFAQLEYKLGEPERAKTLFEGMVDSHPKRWDLWSIYIDMEAGQKDVQSTRLVGNLSLRHALFFLKKKKKTLSSFITQKHFRSRVCSKNDESQGQVSRTRIISRWSLRFLF